MLSKTLPFLDLFAGGGGSGTGSMEAFECMRMRMRGTFVNHWDKAIQIHTLNHPESRHYCTGVDEIDPDVLYPNENIHTLWASPVCTHHSTARGGKPVSEQSRATAQCVVRWIRHKKPEFMLVENVPEFRDWGPLTQKRSKKTGRRSWIKITRWTTARGLSKEKQVEVDELPEELRRQPRGMSRQDYLKMLSDHGYEMALVADKKKKRQMFDEWVRRIRKMGYIVYWKIHCAADFGDPTSRRRIFVQAVRADKYRICWPTPTHVRRDKVTNQFTRGRLPYRTARDIIDWSDKGISIVDRPRALKEKTMKRIGIGLCKFVIEKIILAFRSGNIGDVFPGFCVPQQQGGAQVRSADDPVSALTTTAAERVVQADISGAIIQQQGQSTAQDPNRPMTSMTAGQHHGVLQAQSYILPQQSSGDRTRSVDDPAPTVTCESRGVGVINCNEGFQVPLEGVMGGNVPRSLDDPVPTVIASRGGGNVARTFLVKLRGTSTVRPVEVPIDAISAGGTHYAHAITEAFQMVIDQHGSNGSCIASLDQPTGTTVTKANAAVVKAEGFIYSSDHRGNAGDAVRSVEDPAPTILAKAKESLVTAPAFMLETAHGQDHRDEGRRVQSLDNPMGAVQASGTNQGVATGDLAFVVPQFGEAEGQTPRTHCVDEPAPAVTSHGAGAVVTAEGSNKFQDGAGVLIPFEDGCLIHTAHAGFDASRVMPLLEPIASMAGNRGDLAIVRPWIYVYYSQGAVGSPIDEPVPTIRTHDGVGVCYPAVEIDGNILVFDIYFRMLSVRELARAQGFAESYSFPVNKTDAVRAIGNAVPRNLARALVLACIGQDPDIMPRVRNVPEIREQIEAHYPPEEISELFGCLGEEDHSAAPNHSRN